MPDYCRCFWWSGNLYWRNARCVVRLYFRDPQVRGIASLIISLCWRRNVCIRVTHLHDAHNRGKRQYYRQARITECSLCAKVEKTGEEGGQTAGFLSCLCDCETITEDRRVD